MLRTIIKREILEYLKSAKLLIGLLIAVVMTAASTTLNVQDYATRHQDYLDAKKELKSNEIEINVFRDPQVLGTLARGKDWDMGGQLKMSVMSAPSRLTGYMHTGWKGNPSFSGFMVATELTVVYKKEDTESLLGRNLEEKEAIIRYLGHSGWAIITKNHFLIFDYVESEKKVLNQPHRNTVINLSEIKGKKVSVFVSHEHADHYSPAIFNWSKAIKNINYIFGFRPRIEHSYVYMAPREKKSIDGLEILTIKSTDAGVGFLVTVDGLVIFHGGDHAYWGGSINSFVEEIDYLAEAEDKFDIVFLALATGTGQRTESLTKGIFYAIEKLQPKVMFPMHAGGREYLYKEFADEAQKKILRTNVCYVSAREDEFIYRNGEINKLN